MSCRTCTNTSPLRQDFFCALWTAAARFLDAAPRSKLSRPQSSNRVREVPQAAAPARYLTRREAAAYVRCSLRFLDGMGLPFIRKGRCKGLMTALISIHVAAVHS